MRLTKKQKIDYIAKTAIAKKDMFIQTIFIYDFIYGIEDYAVYRVKAHLPSEMVHYSQEVTCAKVYYNKQGVPYILVHNIRQYLNTFERVA